MGRKKKFLTNSDFIIRKPKKIERVLFLFRILETKHPLKTFFHGKNRSDYIIRTVSAQILSLLVTWIRGWCNGGAENKSRRATIL